jgi:hypothetical protein
MSEIHITQRDNDRYFKQKLPTWRNGFCTIERKVTFVPDPSNVYEEGEWGYITVNKQKVFVHGSNNFFEIWR